MKKGSGAAPSTAAARIRGVLVFAAVFALLHLAAVWLMPKDQLLVRFCPDLSVNTGYIDLQQLEKETWTSMEYTGWQDGRQTGSVRFQKAFFNRYTASGTDADGHPLSLEGWVSRGLQSQWQYTRGGESITLESNFSRDLLGRTNQIRMLERQGKSSRSLRYLELVYSDVKADILLRQVSGGAQGQELGWRSIDQADAGYGMQVTGTRDYDADGQLLGYAVYSYDQAVRCTVEEFDAADTLLGSSVTWYDWFGRIQRREHYDADGQLTGREVYHYRFWERYASWQGLAVLVVSLGLSATFGLAAGELPRRKENYAG